MRQGRAVAGVIGAPQDLAALAGGFRRIADIAETFGPYQGNVLVARRAWATDHDRELTGIARAVVAAQDDVFRRKSAATDVLHRHSAKMTEEEARLMYDRLTGPGGLCPGAAIDVEGVETVLQIRAKFGEPKKSLGPIRTYVDTSRHEQVTSQTSKG